MQSSRRQFLKQAGGVSLALPWLAQSSQAKPSQQRPLDKYAGKKVIVSYIPWTGETLPSLHFRLEGESFSQAKEYDLESRAGKNLSNEVETIINQFKAVNAKLISSPSNEIQPSQRDEYDNSVLVALRKTIPPSRSKLRQLSAGKN